MYQVRKQYNGEVAASYQIGRRRFSFKSDGAIMYPTKEEANKAASEAGAGAYAKAIAVNVADYKELAIINDSVAFIGAGGLHYSVFTVSLEDLIDLI